MHLSFKNKFYFIRHGETDFNSEKRYTGLIDISINQKGVQQVKSSIKVLENLNISTIYSSPLKRARQTAEIISSYLDIPIIIIDSFKEKDFGILNGDKKPNYKKKHFYKGQSSYTYKRDTIRAFTKINNKQNVLIVAHSGTYKELIKYILNSVAVESPRNALPICFYQNEKKIWNARELSI